MRRYTLTELVAKQYYIVVRGMHYSPNHVVTKYKDICGNGLCCVKLSHHKIFSVVLKIDRYGDKETI
jgi:hypothetical protein